jgi:hypothetical protein
MHSPTISVLPALEFFWQLGVLGIGIALFFGIILFRFFKYTSTATNIFVATSYFLCYSTFGVALGYYMSLGIKADGLLMNGNDLLTDLMTPFIALLTAGVAYFANKTSEGDYSPAVPAGVICFMLGTMFSYQALRLDLEKRYDEKLETIQQQIEEEAKSDAVDLDGAELDSTDGADSITPAP